MGLTDRGPAAKGMKAYGWRFLLFSGVNLSGSNSYNTNIGWCRRGLK